MFTAREILLPFSNAKYSLLGTLEVKDLCFTDDKYSKLFIPIFINCSVVS